MLVDTPRAAGDLVAPPSYPAEMTPFVELLQRHLKHAALDARAVAEDFATRIVSSPKSEQH